MEQYLNLIKKSLNIERKYGYQNIKGKTCYFNEFIKLKLEELLNSSINSCYIKPLKELKFIFNSYDTLTLFERKNCIYSLENLLDRILNNKTENTPVITESSLSKISVEQIKGIGVKIAKQLKEANILTVEDIIKYFPKKHLNYANFTKIKDAKIGETVTIYGIIEKVDIFQSPKNKNLTIVTITIKDNTGFLNLYWYYQGNNKWYINEYKNKFKVGSQIVVSGTVRVSKYGKRKCIDKPEIELLEKTDKLSVNSLIIGKIVPVYSSIGTINIKTLRKIINTTITTYYNEITDYLPEYIIKKFNLYPLKEAIKEFHFPTSLDSLKKARVRLVFDELFFIQLGLFYKRKQREIQEQGLNISYKGELVNKFLSNLPFKLTESQNKVFNEILNDLSSDKPMNRLIQGDVGSGKTVVAFMAILAVVEKGYQGALMVPTEILAEQHYQKAILWLSPLNVSVDLITGSQTKKARLESLEKLASGQTHIVIGTHALIQDEVNFKNLGLVVIDEQHRFGVKQRALLKSKGQNPGIITMTATPIPRTLALTMHGDLDISIIDELPPNRQPVETRIIRKNKRIVWEFIKEILNKGQQVYIVYPLIEESETLDLQAATIEYERIKKIFPQANVGLLHGKLSNFEKDTIMRDFINNKINILVSTTVIEVGVDVPNATVMVIENAERFGLAQLHQLRGRIGRGTEKGYCFLITDSDSDISEQRLNILAQTTNGFVIAEQDLKLRGPGEFLGTRQSGLPDLLLTNIAQDTVILDMARLAAKEVINKDNFLTWQIHKELKSQLFKTFINNLEFLEA